jgi:hypothetical protein
MIEVHYHCEKCGAALDKRGEYHYCDESLVKEKFTSTNSAMDAILALKKRGISGDNMYDVGWNGAINTVVDVLKQHQ